MARSNLHRGYVGPLVAIASGVLAAGAGMGMGPIDPPPGPVEPTGVSLSEVEPRTPVQSLTGDAEALYVISQPGSYYLTGNIGGVAGLSGIKVTADNVTIDLMGFALIGIGGPTSQSGIRVTNPGFTVSNFEVRNGTIRGWGGYGVNGDLTVNARVEDLRTTGNGATGIRLNSGALITGCVCEGDFNGIETGGFSMVQGCVVRNVSGFGITCNTGDSEIIDCFVLNAQNTGIVCGSAGLVSRCTVAGSTFYGIHMTGVGGLVERCTSARNGHHGIVVGGGATVIGNNCRQNGAAIAVGSGIQAEAADTRIEGNNLILNDRGITTAVAGCLVIRNSASGNGTAYVFAGGTVAGPTVTAAGIGASSNPHANYDF